MSYGKVKDTFWTDKKVRAFSDDAKMLALYLMTGPHRNILGCMRVPTGYILEDLRWAPDRLHAAVKVLVGSDFICRDDEGWTLICNQLRHDPLKVPNHARAAISLANEVPTDSPVFHALKPRLIANLNTIGMASEWHVEGIAIPEPLPLPEPLPEPEPEEGKATPAKPADPLPPPDDCAAAFDAWNDLAAELKLPMVERRSPTRIRSLRPSRSPCRTRCGQSWLIHRCRCTAQMAASIPAPGPGIRRPS
jgi:hypothetical protein